MTGEEMEALCKQVVAEHPWWTVQQALAEVARRVREWDEYA